MSAFLHPENLLLPSLRSDRTGAFDRLVGALQAPGRLTPGAARAAAANYMADLDADMSADMSADLGRDRLVGHWPLNEGQGTSVADVTGITQPGTLNNGPQWTPRGNDQALSFDGKDDRVDFTAGPRLRDLVNDFTIAFWAFPAAAQEDPNDPQRQTRTQVSHFAITPVRGSSIYGSDDHVGVGISVDADGIEVREFGVSFLSVLAYASQVGLAEWTHVAVVYEDRQPSLYVDGQFVMSGTKSTKGYVHASPAGFGGAPGASAKSYFQGLLQDVRIYDHALPAQAVEKLKGLRILPAQLRPPFVLTDRLSDQDLRNRRDLAERVLQVAGLNSPTYLKEVFYFAPLQIALQLQKSGEFTAALAWFRSVYAYNLPPDANLPPQPKIYYLLQLEKSVSN